jgi:ComF family protein
MVFERLFFPFSLLLARYAPQTCAACDAVVPEGHAFCAGCRVSVEHLENVDPAELRPLVQNLAVSAPFLYAGALATAVRRFKYEDRSDLGTPLGKVLAGAVERPEAPVDFVVPIPSTPSRLATRGCNPAAQMARPLAARWGSPFLATALRRKESPHQAGLSGEERRRLHDGIFQATTHRMHSAHIALVDDVVTTGATLAAAQAALFDAGAAKVTCFALARA